MKTALTIAAFSLFMSAGPLKAQEKLSVLLDWFVNPDHAPLIVAHQKGMFKEAGLDLEMIAPADPNDPPKLVAAGQGDIAISYQPQLHVQADRGLPLVRFGTLVATPLNSLVVLDDGPIQGIADLKGRKIGYSVGGFEESLLSAMLAKEGLSLDDVELINVNFSLSPSILSGQVDAVIGAFRNFELNQMDIVGSPGRAFYVEEHGVPAYDELIFITHRDSLERPELKTFLQVIEQATQYIINHPDEAWSEFIAYDKNLDDELNIRAWHSTLPRFALRPAALDQNRYEVFAQFLLEQKLIDEIRPIQDYAVSLP